MSTTSEATQFYNNFSFIEELYVPQAQTTQAWDQSLCNGATMFPTPSPSPISLQTSPFSSCHSEEGEMAYSDGEVKLRIIEQPVPMFRFRYRSEMNGAHGSLLGQSENPKRKTYPTVELVNFEGEAIIRCSLYTASPPHIPHMHQLIAKPSNNKEILDHEVTVSDRNGYRAEFRGLGIVHMAKKNLTKELMRKKEKDLIEKLKKQKNLPHFGDERQQIALKEMLPQLEAAAKRDAETMDANKLRLCFEAFERGPNGEMHELCERVFSDTIQNMKSAETGGLKICRIDKCAGSCNGGDEIYILVEKVCKKNVKIRFFEDDENGHEVWSDEGLFSENDVHHQYAIVFRTPPYKKTDIEKNVPVKVELVRPKDNARSDPVPFHYKPARRYGQKRPCTSFSSLESNSSFEAPKRSKAPVMISGDDPMISGEKAISWNLPSEALSDVMKELSTEHIIDENFANFILSPELASYSQALNESKDKGGSRVEDNQNMFLLQSEHSDFSPNMSSPGCLETFVDLSIERNSDWQTDGPGSKQNKEKHVDVVAEGVSSKNHLVKKTASSSEDEAVKVTSNLAKNAYDKLLKLMKSRHPSRLQDMKNIIRAEDQEFGPLHAAVIHGQLKELSDLLSLVIKSNQLKLINTSNRRRQTPLMVAVEENRVDCLKLLCMARADISQADYEENTAFHIAVKNKNSECLQVLLSAKKSQDSSCKIDLNRRNEYGETALHIAVMKNDMKCVTQLVAAGADLNVKTGTSGSTPLHIAVEANSSEIVRLLLSQENINVNEVNFSIKTPADLIKPSQKTITSLFMKFQGELNVDGEIGNEVDDYVEEDDDDDDDNDDDDIDDEDEDDDDEEEEDDDDEEEEEEDHGENYGSDDEKEDVVFSKQSDNVNNYRHVNGDAVESYSDGDTSDGDESDSKDGDDKGNFSLIDDATRSILIESLDRDNKWRVVCQNLNCSFLLRTFSSVASPSRILLTYLEFEKKISLLEFKNALKNLNVPEATKALDRLLVSEQ